MAKPVKIKRYGSIYKHRRRGPSGGFWKVMGWIVFFLLVVIAAFFLFSQILGHPSGEGEPSSSIISSSSEEPSRQQELSSQSEPVQQEAVTMTVMPTELLNQPSERAVFLSTAKTNGYTSVVVPYKTSEGIVIFQSQSEGAANWGTVGQNAMDAKTIADEITAAGLKPVAQLCAFLDNQAANARRDNAVSYQGEPSTTWLDGNQRNRWLNPYKDSARKYLVDLTTELVTAGYQDIVYTYVQFPAVQGRYDLFDNGISKSQILTQFINELKATGANVILSYRWSAMTGGGEMMYGGNPATYGASAVAPILDISQYPNGIDNNGTPITSVNEMVSYTVTQLKATAPSAEIMPILPQSENLAEWTAALQAAGVENYIEDSSNLLS